MLNNNQIKEIRELRKQGKTVREIARKVGCDENTVYKYLGTLGIKTSMTIETILKDVEARKYYYENKMQDYKIKIQKLEEIERRITRSNI